MSFPSASLRLSLGVACLLTACARPQAPQAADGVQPANQSVTSAPSKITFPYKVTLVADAQPTSPTDAKTGETKANKKPEAQPNFMQRFFIALSQGLGGFYSAAITRPTADDKARVEASSQIVKRDEQRRALSQIPTAKLESGETSPMSTETAQLLGDRGPKIRQEFLSMLSAPTTKEALTQADIVVNDLWAKADEAKAKFTAITDTIGEMEQAKVYDRNLSTRVSFLTAKIDRKLKQDEFVSALPEVAGIATFSAALAYATELRALRLLRARDFERGIGNTTIGHALADTHGFAPLAFEHNQAVAIPILHVAGVDLSVLNRLQLSGISPNKLENIAWNESKTPQVKFALINRTKNQLLGEHRAILLRVEVGVVGEYRWMVSQPFSASEAEKIAEKLAAPSIIEEAPALGTGPRPRGFRVENPSIEINETADAFATVTPEATLARAENAVEAEQGATSAAATVIDIADARIPTGIPPGAANIKPNALPYHPFPQVDPNLHVLTFEEAKALAKKAPSDMFNIDGAQVMRNFAASSIILSVGDYAVHARGRKDGVITSDYFLESRLTPERIQELHAPVE